AAPFGTQEYHLLNYGLKDTHFTYDAKGNPVLTQKGQDDLNISAAWGFTSVPMPVLFDPIDPEFVKAAYADQHSIAPSFVRDPSAGLYSATNFSKGGGLTRTFSDGLGEIVTGRSPLAALDQLVKDWRTGGGDEMRSEYQRAYSDSRREAGPVMSDEEEIRQRLALWAEKDADHDAPGWASLFTETGKYVSPRGEFAGRAAIQKMIEDRTARNPPNRHTMHILGLPVVTVSGDTAESACAYVAYGRVGDDPWQIMTIGRLHHRLERQAGVWLFSEIENRPVGSAGGPATIVREAAETR